MLNIGSGPNGFCARVCIDWFLCTCVYIDRFVYTLKSRNACVYVIYHHISLSYFGDYTLTLILNRFMLYLKKRIKIFLTGEKSGRLKNI